MQTRRTFLGCLLGAIPCLKALPVLSEQVVARCFFEFAGDNWCFEVLGTRTMRATVNGLPSLCFIGLGYGKGDCSAWHVFCHHSANGCRRVSCRARYVADAFQVDWLHAIEASGHVSAPNTEPVNIDWWKA